MRLRYKDIVKVAFLLLSLIIFSNLNGVLRLSFGVVSLLSPMILLLSLIIIGVATIKLNISIRDRNLHWILGFYFLYLFISTASLLWSDKYLNDGFVLRTLYRSYISSTLIITAFYLASKSILRERSEEYIFKLILPFFVFTTATVVFGEKLGLYNSFEYMAKAQRGERGAGFFGNPNEAGAFANYSLVVFLTSYFIMKRKLIPLALTALAVMGSIISFSKAAFILSIFLILLFFWKSLASFFRSTLKTRAYFIGIIFLLTLVVQSFIFKQSNLNFELTLAQQKRIVGTIALLSGEINEKTTSERNIVYGHGIDVIKENPIVGHGLGTFHKFNSGGLSIGVHNTYLLIFGESGILPLLLFLGFYFMLTFHGFRMTNPGLSFFIIGVVSVYGLSISGTSHNALDDRTSNALVGIILAILYNKKRCVA